MKRHPTTKWEAFEARAERVAVLAGREGPAAGRITLAIREGLLAPGRHFGTKERGGLLGSVVHCINLVKIHVEEENQHGRHFSVAKIEATSEPESILVYLATAAAQLERLMAAVSAELD